MFFVSSFSGTAAFPQAVKFIRHAADPLPLAKKDPVRSPCTGDPAGAVYSPHAAGAASGEAEAPCDSLPVIAPPVNPCGFRGMSQIGCNAVKDPVRENLAAMGKTGKKILLARDRVLEILQNENGCSAWFREKDPSPAATFQTLSYAVDHHGEELVHVSRDNKSLYTYRDPYVAKVGQDTGAFATITLNAGGAFFRLQATTLLVPEEGGLGTSAAPRLISVGPYPGDTKAAQTLVLLHEFGHVLDLLPVDFDNEDGKSMRNTNEILRFCRAEIESGVKRGTFAAAR